MKEKKKCESRFDDDDPWNRDRAKIIEVKNTCFNSTPSYSSFNYIHIMCEYYELELDH